MELIDKLKKSSGPVVVYYSGHEGKTLILTSRFARIIRFR